MVTITYETLFGRIVSFNESKEFIALRLKDIDRAKGELVSIIDIK